MGEEDLRCKLHSGIAKSVEALCKQCEDLKVQMKEAGSSRKTITEKLETKISSSTMRWAVGIVVFVMLSILGFLWSNQTSLGKQMEQNRKGNIEGQNMIVEKIDGIKENISDIRTSLKAIEKDVEYMKNNK